MKSTLKMGVKVFGKIILANVMSIITVVSLSFIVTAMFTENIGYQAFGTTSTSSESELLYEYYYENGEDTQLPEYEEQGYTVNQVSIRSGVSKTGNAVFLVLCALFCMSLVAILTYTLVWKEGNKDLNLARFDRIKYDKLKGVKIGLIAAAPSLVLLLVLSIGKSTFSSSFPVIFYQYLNAAFFAPMDLICGSAVAFGDLAIWQILLLLLVLLLIPAFSGFAYYIGYKDILLSDKLIYKKQK